MKTLYNNVILFIMIQIVVLLALPVSLGAYFSQVQSNIPGVINGSTILADYDNDGDLDVLQMGAYDSMHWRTSIYQNNGSGIFSDIGAQFQEFYMGSAAWGDMDNDGDLDLLFSGAAMISGMWNTFTMLYVNDGNGIFHQINTTIVGVYKGASTWGDFDNDGLCDILITGYSFQYGDVSKLYRNEGNGYFSEMTNSMIGISDGSCAAIDFNNDGFLDIILAGETSAGAITKIYMNDGYWNFTESNTGLVAVSNGSIDCGDLDNDGFQDLLLTGDTGLGYVAIVYRNNAGMGFTDFNAGLLGVTNGSASWGDIDNDNDLDVVITGDTGSGIISKIYVFNGIVFSELPTTLSGVRYSSTSWGDLNGDGYRDLLISGESSNGHITSMYMNVGNPGFTMLDYGFAPVYGGHDALCWVDYDNDGDLDVMLSGFTEQSLVTTLYRNDGNGVFVDIQADFVEAYGTNIDWGDFDNDGDLDMLYAGMSPNISLIYRNDGNDTFTEMDLEFTAVSLPAVAWVDFDNDGDLDATVAGHGPTGTVTALFENTNGVFSYLETGIEAAAIGSLDWGDYDNDGDLDLLLTGLAVSGKVSKIYRNDGNGVFTDIDAGLVGVYDSQAVWGDYDNDGLLDILLTGKDNNDNRISKIYHNAGNGVFIPINANIIPVMGSTTDWIDYDNDGDLDLIVSGWVNDNINTTKVYRNEGNGVFNESGIRIPGVRYGATSWGDYDFDGDMDLLICGWHMNTPISLVLRNDCQINNNAPSPPNNLTATQNGNYIIFSWDEATDDHTPSSGLSYSLRIGSTPGGSQILSPSEMPNGFSRTPRRGNVTSNCQWKIDVSALPPQGLCYWSVQAIDTGYLCSTSSVESIFASQLAALFTSDVTVGYHPLAVQFVDQSIPGAGYNITSLLWDFGDGSTSTLPNPYHTYANPGIYSVSLQVQDSANNTSFLLREAYITVLDATPVLALSDTLIVFINAYPANPGQNRYLYVKNTGYNPLIVSTITLGNTHSGFIVPALSYPLQISMGDSIAIPVTFGSSTPNTVIDFLNIFSNAINGPISTIRLVAMAMDTPLKAPSGLRIELSGSGTQIRWEPVTETILNTPATPLFYLVFTSPTGSNFGFHGVTESQNYFHNYVTAFSRTMFYKVKAYWSPNRDVRDLIALSQGMSEEEVTNILAKNTP